MADFYATYSSSGSTGTSVTQGTTPWIVAGQGTAGTAATGVVTIQGIASGTAVPISGTITANNASVGTTGAAVPASGTYVGMNVAGTLTGMVGTASGLQVDGSAVTQPISAASLPLPTGAATETTLSSINTKTPALGQAAMAASSPVVIASDQSAVPVSGSVTVSGTVAATQSGTWNIGTLTSLTNALPAGTNIIGKVGIDQTTPGTTNGVVVNTIAPVTTTTAVFQAEGAVAFGSITNAYVTLFTPTAATKILQMRNNTDAAISVSFDSGTTTNYTLDSGDMVSFDLLANALVMSTTAIQVKYAVGAPTSGSFRINGAH